MDPTPSHYSSHMSLSDSHNMLGIEKPVPLTAERMAAELQLTIFPHNTTTAALDRFLARLEAAFAAAGVRLLPYAEALAPGTREKVREGIVLLTPGEGETGNLAADHISSLFNNQVVGIFDAPCPVNEASSLQEKLDAIVSVLAWQMVHMAIFVHGGSVTICTMNGAVIEYDQDEAGMQATIATLIPKLTAQVVPPRIDEIAYRYGALDVSQSIYDYYVADFLECGRIWSQSEAMMSHTSVDSVNYRSRLYRRIVSTFLDQRSGMSYGFFAWQLATPVRAARRAGEAPPAGRHVPIYFQGHDYLVPVPDVWVLSTRSGCNKFHLNPERDLVRLGLIDGQVVVETPAGIDSAADCKPSYDTVTILAHAVGNALTASLLARQRPDAAFVKALSSRGASLTHWHGYPDGDHLPAGYFWHGHENPSVSCSTPQSALYSLLGKLDALTAGQDAGVAYRGDVHIEPHHGTNVVGAAGLADIARWYQATNTATVPAVLAGQPA